MRKKVYGALEVLDNGDMVSHYFFQMDEMSSRVRNEIYELRRNYRVEIITVEGFVGRCAAYFLVDSEENLKRVKMLLKMHKKREK